MLLLSTMPLPASPDTAACQKAPSQSARTSSLPRSPPQSPPTSPSRVAKNGDWPTAPQAGHAAGAIAQNRAVQLQDLPTTAAPSSARAVSNPADLVSAPEAQRVPATPDPGRSSTPHDSA